MDIDMDKLIRIVVEEVIKQLRQNDKKSLKGKKILAVFTAGHTGLKDAFEGIKEVIKSGADVKLAPSQNALKVIGKQRFQNSLTEASFINSENETVLDEIRGADMILFPVLTQNSLVKMALGICDTLPLQIASWGIMMGKKILVAKNAADPKSLQKAELGIGNAPKPYCDKIYGYFEALEKYGIVFCDVKDLSEKTHLLVDSTLKTADFQGHLLTQKDVKEYRAMGVKKIFINRDSIITPLAREMAQKSNIVFKQK